MVKRKELFVAEDGKEFDSYEEARAHEHRSEQKDRENYNKYIGITYSGKELMRKHGLGEYGIWHVFGEDPNCDMGGTHIEPDLGFFEGKLEDVIRKAVTLPRFWAWGGGGRIVKQVPPDVIKV